MSLIPELIRIMNHKDVQVVDADFVSFVQLGTNPPSLFVILFVMMILLDSTSDAMLWVVFVVSHADLIST